jgi:hypothetical protein
MLWKRAIGALSTLWNSISFAAATWEMACIILYGCFSGGPADRLNRVFVGVCKVGSVCSNISIAIAPLATAVGSSSDISIAAAPSATRAGSSCFRPGTRKVRCFFHRLPLPSESSYPASWCPALWTAVLPWPLSPLALVTLLPAPLHKPAHFSFKGQSGRDH